MSKVDINIPEGARSVIITPNGTGGFRQQAVFQGESALNIEKDLFSHMSETPYSDEWLLELQSYVTARLQARAAARKAGGFAFREDRNWCVVTDTRQYFKPVEVRA